MWSANSRSVIRIYLIVVFLSEVTLSSDSGKEALEVKNPECMTAACKERSKQYKSSIDTSANPCTDFYQYICGNWKRIHPLPPYRRAWILEFAMESETYTQVRGLLEEGIKSTDKIEVKQAKMVYKTCMNIPNLKRAKPQFLRSYVIESGYFPMFFTSQRSVKKRAPWKINNYYLGLTGESSFFGVTVAVNPNNYKEPIICLNVMLSPYGTVIRNDNWKEHEMKNFILYLESIVKSVSPRDLKIPKKEFQEQLNEVLFLRMELQKVVRRYRDESPRPVIMSIKDFQEWYDRATDKLDFAQIDWLKQVQALYKNIKIGDNNVIKIMRIDYFKSLAELLHRANERAIVNHIQLYFLERHMDLSDYQKRLLENSVSYSPVVTGGIYHEEDRWFVCIDEHTMMETIGRMYIERYFPGSTRKQAYRLAENVKRMIKEQISDSSWLDSEMKSRTMSRIEAVRFTIGYPKWYMKAWEEEDAAMPKNILKAYAAFRLFDNRMIYYAGYLKPPMFDESMPYALNYGATASSMGHEMYHSLDTMAINAKNQEKSLWPVDVYTIYKDKTKCFVEQYNNYPIKELHNFHPKLMVDGEKTCAENIADTMGLKAAYRAFKKNLLQKNGVCPILPNFHHATCEQLFFIAYAASHCGIVPNNILLEQATMGMHAPPRARVNLPLANMREFAVAFNCLKTDFLNPVTRCDIWE
ncbi:hypothetical protein KM043_015075 [Ampulex compressa]|nr:hypothetical protein KM043_015075 [Ampulex compressa]